MTHSPKGGPPANALGDELRRLRTRRRLSQEQLARRLDSDKGQVSKRERGTHHPRRDTLQRYAEALQLDNSERRELFALAGYAVEQPPIMPEDFMRVVEAVRDEWLARPWPAAVVADTRWTLWHANDAFARLFSLVSAPNLTGKHMLELCFDPVLGMKEALHRISDDAEIDRFIAHLLERFRRHRTGMASESWWKRLEERLRTFHQFAAAWDTSRRVHRVGTVARLAYLNLRGGGQLIMVGGPARADERFILALFLPTDVRSADILERAYDY